MINFEPYRYMMLSKALSEEKEFLKKNSDYTGGIIESTNMSKDSYYAIPLLNSFNHSKSNCLKSSDTFSKRRILSLLDAECILLNLSERVKELRELKDSYFINQKITGTWFDISFSSKIGMQDDDFLFRGRTDFGHSVRGLKERFEENYKYITRFDAYSIGYDLPNNFAKGILADIEINR